MEAGTTPKPPGKRSAWRGRGKVMPKVSVEEQILQAEVPAGARFKGYEDFVLQDLVLRARVIREELCRLRRENRQLRLEQDILSNACPGLDLGAAAWFARETNAIPAKGSGS